MPASARGGLDRRAFIVDGSPMEHWKKDNFEPQRDESCRVIFTPKEGPEFFRKSLRVEDYMVMRNSSSVMEQPFFSKYNRFYPKKGHFCCKGCGNPLYSHETKLRREDGWPAFGACVDGAIGMTTAEERREKEARDREAATIIQAFVRGATARAKVSSQVELLIEKVMEIQKLLEREETNAEENVEYGDTEEDLKDGSIKKETIRQTYQSLQRLSLHSLADFTFTSDGNSSATSFASFGEEDAPAILEPTPAGHSELSTSSGSAIAASAACAAKNRALMKEAEDAEISEYNELLIEIHCHRCKSFLGNVYGETNRGQDGITKFKERHRVNGRALKFVEDNLPKRTRTDASLLFASTSQARLLGLKPAEPEKNEPEFIRVRNNRTAPYVSPRAKQRKAAFGARPGVGAVTFQSPQRSPRKRLTSKQKEMENFFLSRTVH